jgi:nucleoside-diphosphate-sugar epimerase
VIRDTDRVLVTGAAGFIGAHLCRRLVAEGVEVIGIDDLSAGSLESLRDVPEVRFVEADVRDEAALARAAEGCGAILHQAAKRSVPFSIREPGLVTDVNLRGSLNVMLAARDTGAVVVQASSSSVYGDQDEFPLRESMRVRPRSPYAASKASAELYAAAAWTAYGVPTVSLRYFNVYGPGQNPESEYAAVVPRFAVACLTGSRPEVHGDGSQSRDFTYIDDVVEANLLAMRASEPAFGRAFNIGGGATPTTVRELLDLIAEACGVEPDPVFTPPREGDILRSEADVSLAADLLDFRPEVSIREGVHRTVERFRSQRIPSA